MQAQRLPSAHHQRLFVAAVLWLCTGSFLLITTLVPVHTGLLGWTPAFWLFVAPLVVLLALEPRLPRLCLMRRRSRRVQAIHGVIWH